MMPEWLVATSMSMPDGAAKIAPYSMQVCQGEAQEDHRFTTNAEVIRCPHGFMDIIHSLSAVNGLLSDLSQAAASAGMLTPQVEGAFDEVGCLFAQAGHAQCHGCMPGSQRGSRIVGMFGRERGTECPCPSICRADALTCNMFRRSLVHKQSKLVGLALETRNEL